ATTITACARFSDRYSSAVGMVMRRWQAFNSSLVRPWSSGPKMIATRLASASAASSHAASRGDTALLRYSPGRQVVPTVRVRSASAEARSRWTAAPASTSPPCTAIVVAVRSRADATGATRRRSLNPMFLSARETDPILPACIGRHRTKAIRSARFMARVDSTYPLRPSLQSKPNRRLRHAPCGRAFRGAGCSGSLVFWHPRSMALLRIRKFPDDVLKHPARKVESINGDLNSLIDSMAQTMYAAPGVGLAAPQVGESKRVIVLDTDHEEPGKHLLKLINPRVVEAEGKV